MLQRSLALILLQNHRDTHGRCIKAVPSRLVSGMVPNQGPLVFPIALPTALGDTLMHVMQMGGVCTTISENFSKRASRYKNRTCTAIPCKSIAAGGRGNSPFNRHTSPQTEETHMNTHTHKNDCLLVVITLPQLPLAFSVREDHRNKR